METYRTWNFTNSLFGINDGLYFNMDFSPENTSIQQQLEEQYFFIPDNKAKQFEKLREAINALSENGIVRGFPKRLLFEALLQKIAKCAFSSYKKSLKTKKQK
jgi:hypothetical protein